MVWPQRTQTSLGWSLEAEAPAVENSHIAHLVWLKIYLSSKADGYSTGGIGTFGRHATLRDSGEKG